MTKTRRRFDITKNYAVAIGVFGILCFFGPVAAEQIPVDTVRLTSHEAILKDCCGDQIPAEQAAKNKRPERPYPPQASECCAYENVGDDLVVMYSAQPVLSAEYKSYLVVEENGVIVYEQPIAAGVGPNGQFREGRWPLSDTAGAPLNVGKDGKRYKVRVEIRKGGLVIDKSGYLEILVDDCVKRQEAVRAMKTEISATADQAFLIYLSLEDGVATEICEYVKRGLTDYTIVDFDSATSSFNQRCDVQCINNSFANELLIAGREPPNINGSIFAQAHYIAQRMRQIDNSPENIDLFPLSSNIRQASTTFKNLLLYIDAEDHLRARGYRNCSGPLNSVDEDLAIVIIQRQFDEVLLGGYGFGNFLWVGDIVSEQEIRRHFEQTRDIYQNLP